MAYEQNNELKALQVWFYVFALLTVILIAREKALSVFSNASLIMMIWVSQMRNGYREELRAETHEKIIAQLQVDKNILKERLDRIDPYSEE
jgi:hypothetical protein